MKETEPNLSGCWGGVFGMFLLVGHVSACVFWWWLWNGGLNFWCCGWCALVWLLALGANIGGAVVG